MRHASGDERKQFGEKLSGLKLKPDGASLVRSIYYSILSFSPPYKNKKTSQVGRKLVRSLIYSLLEFSAPFIKKKTSQVERKLVRSI